MRHLSRVFRIKKRGIIPLSYSLIKRNGVFLINSAFYYKRLKKLPAVNFICLVAIAVVILTSSGCGASNVPVIGTILDGLSNDVNNIVSNAAINAESDILAAAGSVQDAIDTAASAYATDLNLTMSQVSSQISSTINQLQDLVNQLNKNVAQTLQTTTNDAQQLLNSIPFTNKNPQVTSYTPHFISVSGPIVEVVVNGNFVYAAQKNLRPTLSVNGSIIQPDLNTTNQLGFSVPVALLPTPSNAIQNVSLELDAPYEEGLVFQSKALDAFHLLVSIMPKNPVTSLTLYTTQAGGQAQKTIIQPSGASITGGGWHLASNQDCQTHTITESFAADTGWTIISSSAQAVITQNKNPAAATWNVNAGPGHAQLNATTTPNCTCVIVCVSNGSGDLTLYLTYTEEQPLPPTQTFTNLQIGWGDTISAPVTSGWTLKAKLFNGKEVDFNDTDRSNNFLQVVNHSANITISAQFSDVTF